MPGLILLRVATFSCLAVASDKVLLSMGMSMLTQSCRDFKM